MAIFTSGTTPFVLKAGDGILIKSAANTSGTISIAGEAVSDTITSSKDYWYGLFDAQREVVVTVTSGSVDVTVGGGSTANLDSQNNLLGPDGGVVLTGAELAAIKSGGGNKRWLSKKLSKTGRWATALTSGSAPRVLIIGDSTWVGFGHTTTANDWRPNGVTKILGDAIAALGKSVQPYQNYFGTGYDVATAYNTVDSRLTLTGTLALTASQSIGGQHTLMTSGQVIRFTPATGTFDTAVVYWMGYNGAGSFAVTSSLGAHGTISQQMGTPTMGSTTISLGGAASWIEFTGVSGNSTPVGVEAYNASSTAIRLLNVAFGGAQSGQIILGGSTGYQYGGGVAKINADLEIVGVGINDWVNNSTISAETYAANLYARVNTSKTAGRDVIIATAYASRHSSVAQELQERYQEAARGVGAMLSVPVVDLRREFGGWEGINAAGGMNDTYHPKAPVYAAAMKLLAEAMFAFE